MFPTIDGIVTRHSSYTTKSGKLVKTVDIGNIQVSLPDGWSSPLPPVGQPLKLKVNVRSIAGNRTVFEAVSL